MFNGFTQAASDFLWGIRFNNYRDWFMEHKQGYLTLVQEPLKELAGGGIRPLYGEIPRFEYGAPCVPHLS